MRHLSNDATATYGVVSIVAMGLLLASCSATSQSTDDARVVTRSVGSPSICLSGVNGQSISDDVRQTRIKAGDELSVNFYLSSELDEKVVVRPDGRIDLRLAGNIQAAGLTPEELSESVDAAYSNELRSPGAMVRIERSPSRLVYVAGEVEHPGAVSLQPQMTALEAIAQSGGLKDTAGLSKVILIRRDACGEPRGQLFNLKQVLNQKDNEQDIALLPSDLIIVPKSSIANANLWMKQYIRDMLPLQPYIGVP